MIPRKFLYVLSTYMTQSTSETSVKLADCYYLMVRDAARMKPSIPESEEFFICVPFIAVDLELASLDAKNSRENPFSTVELPLANIACVGQEGLDFLQVCCTHIYPAS